MSHPLWLSLLLPLCLFAAVMAAGALCRLLGRLAFPLQDEEVHGPLGLAILLLTGLSLLAAAWLQWLALPR